MAADTTVKVTRETREKLGTLAAEQGLSIGALLELYTQQHPSQAQIDAQRERTRAALQEWGYDPTPEEKMELDRKAAAKWAAIEAREAEIVAETLKASA